MIGGGSIQNMQVTLKNNKDLLRKRKSIFKKNSGFRELRRRYIKVSKEIVNEKKATKEEIEKIRKNVIAERKREIINQAITAVIVSLIAFGSVVLIAHNQRIKRMERQERREIFDSHRNAELEKNAKTEYNENMSEGLKMMEKRRWFFAAGYFETALTYVPKDPKAEYNLATAYCLLCFNERIACRKANDLIDSLIKENPETNKYQALKTKYLNSQIVRMKN